MNTNNTSLDERTYRSTLEAQMGGNHAAMSQAGNVMLEYLTADEEAYDVTALRGVWQEIRTPAARYAEALSLAIERRVSEDGRPCSGLMRR